MRLKTYSAGNMAVALAMVKHDLGPKSVILHTRTYKQGGFLGLGCQSVVEITAADSTQLGQSKQKQRAAVRGAGTGGTGGTGRSGGPGRSVAVAPVPHQSAGDLIRRTYVVAKAELAKQAAGAQSASAVTAPVATVAGPVGAPVRGVEPATDRLAEEMREMKRMVSLMMRQNSRSTSGPHMPEKLIEQYQSLLEKEVSQELADEVIHKVSRLINEEQCDSEQAVAAAMRSVLAKLIPTDDAAGRFKPGGDGRPRTIVLVGPTGVGKTTTVAKLAATFKLKQQKSVGLVTLDTYRIAAVDQLRTYANIIGLPLRVVTDQKEMVDAMQGFSRCDVVLIDTIGRSQRDGQSLSVLAGLVKAARAHEVHLVLSSTCAQSVLMDTIEQFAPVGPDRIIFTKLDEAVSLGVLLNVARKVDKRLSYITTGQEVPHKIEVSEPGRIAELVLEGGLR